MPHHRTCIAVLVFVALGLGACASAPRTIPGTRILDTNENRVIIDTIEAYRLAVERQDAAALVLMASRDYWEDGGTPTGSDDYGFDQLRDVLAGRFQLAADIRYSLRYMNIERRCPPDADGDEGCRAYVDVLIDASFSVTDARGQQVRKDKRDQNQLVLQYQQGAWKFLSGM
jgi:hypothetical protein